MHIFVEFKVSFYVELLKNFLSTKYESNIDCKPCKSKKTLLKYITKHDKTPLFNCSSSKFHFNYRIYDWASNTNTFDIEDDFVTDHRQHLSFLKKYFDSKQKKKILAKNTKLELIQSSPDVLWCIKFCLWFNHFITHENFLGNKLRQIYLWGPSNIGKSNLIIQSLFQKSNLEDLAFYPTTKDFAFNELDLNKHKIIIFEEYTKDDVSMNLLKRLLEGLSCSVQRKHKKSLQFKWKHPIIFTSNYKIEGDEAFKNRFIVLKADVSMFNKKRYPLKYLLKKYENENNGELKKFIDKLNENLNIINLVDESNSFIPDDSWFYIKDEYVEEIDENIPSCSYENIPSRSQESISSHSQESIPSCSNFSQNSSEEMFQSKKIKIVQNQINIILSRICINFSLKLLFYYLMVLVF